MHCEWLRVHYWVVVVVQESAPFLWVVSAEVGLLFGVVGFVEDAAVLEVVWRWLLLVD